MFSDALPTSLAEAQALDRIDPLRHLRDAFDLPQGVIYLDGHSLGPPTKAALARVAEAGGDWRNRLIKSWNDAGWIDWPQRLGARLASLIGADAASVHVCDSVSVNLFKLAAAALPLARRRAIMVESDEFPTDQYIADGLGALIDAPVIRLPPGQGHAALHDGGVLIKSAVNYRSASITDMAACEVAAGEGGAVIVWDLSHAAGVLALDLKASGARLAAGCTYKYLNGGPGAPAYVYLAPDLSERLTSPISGWFGHAAPFAFDGDYRPTTGAARFAAGTPAILSCAALDGALDTFDGVAMAAVEAKARALGRLWQAKSEPMGFVRASPADDTLRGGHVTLLHEHGYAIVQALIARGVIGDFRAPDAMRFGFSPLYLSFEDVWRALDILRHVMEEGAWKDPAYVQRAKVT
jgi:kynureninase